MPRTAPRSRLLPIALLLLAALVTPGALARRPPRLPIAERGPVPVAPLLPAVAWPVSGDLVIGEVVTGGAAAEDEWIELHGRGPAAASLAGLELLYVSASGSSVSRRLAFGDTIVQPGTSLLLANAAGVHAPLADATWIGGLAAGGGTVVLRAIGGDVVDALAWGTAANPFVEGLPGVAPPAGSALERLPDGWSRNGRDTNDNRADTWIQPVPVPDGAGAPPTPTTTPGPAPTGTPTAEPTPGSTPTPSPTATPDRSAGPAPTGTPDLTPTPTTVPTETPAATPTSAPTPSPTAVPTATATPTSAPTPTPAATSAPTPAPTAVPTATATPTSAPTPAPTPAATATPAATTTPAPTPAPTAVPTAIATLPPEPIAAFRARPLGARATIVGTVTAPAGVLLDGRVVALQDGTGGVLVRLPAAPAAGDPAPGTILRVTGIAASPYGNLEIRPATADDIRVAGSGGLPAPRLLDVSPTEADEGVLVRVAGTVARTEAGSDGAWTLYLETAGGPVRVYVHAAADVTRDTVSTGARLSVTGIAGQRASSSGAADGYRVWPRSAADLVRAPLPTATPAPGGTAAPVTPRPGDAGGSPRTPIAELEPGSVARIEGVVTTPAGLIDGDGRRIVVQDADGAILVRLPEGEAAPAVGTRIRASGEVATWYDAPQLALTTPATALGRGAVTPLVVRQAPGAALEWRLVRVAVRIEEVSRDGDAWRAEASLGAGGTLPIAGLAGAGIAPDTLATGATATVTGIVRRPWPTASDRRFTLVPRTPADLEVVLPPVVPPAGGEPDTRGAAPDPAAAGGTAIPGTADPVTGRGGAVPVVALADLAAWPAVEVRTGGVVARAGSTAIELRDGAARAVLRLPDGGDGRTFPALVPGAVLNVQGRVRAVAPAPELVVDPAHVVLAPRLRAPDGPVPGIPAEAAQAPAAQPTAPAPAASGADAPGLPVPAIGGLAGALVAVGLAAALAWVGRSRPEDDAPASRHLPPGAA